jgi:tetratricopeptide (TPR) repeat protein
VSSSKTSPPYRNAGWIRRRTFRSYNVFPHARVATDKALQLSPVSAEAYVARGQLRAIFDRDRRGALEDLNRAAILDPRNGGAYFYRGLIYGSQGRFEESQAEFERAEALEPSALARPAAAALQLMYQGRYDEAIARLQKILKANPHFDLARGFLIRNLLAKGDAANALVEIQDHPLRVQGSYGFLASALAIAGRRDEAQAEIERVMVLSQQQYVPAYDIALAFGALHDADAALQWLERAYVDRSTLLEAMSQEPLLRFLKKDPRFIAFVARTES